MMRRMLAPRRLFAMLAWILGTLVIVLPFAPVFVSALGGIDPLHGRPGSAAAGIAWIVVLVMAGWVAHALGTRLWGRRPAVVTGFIAGLAFGAGMLGTTLALALLLPSLLVGFSIRRAAFAGELLPFVTLAAALLIGALCSVWSLLAPPAQPGASSDRGPAVPYDRPAIQSAPHTK